MSQGFDEVSCTNVTCTEGEIKVEQREKSAGAALLWFQRRKSGSLSYVLNTMNSDLPTAEGDWFIHAGPSDLMDMALCFIAWIETLARVTERDRSPTISPRVIASIVIYIRLSGVSLRNQMETLKVRARLKGTEGTGRAARGEEVVGEAACWAQGWRACKRSQWAVKISPIAALSKDSSPAKSQAHAECRASGSISL